tara:strand:- start:121 stop:951 length:831 start_codon:yes stop_codon:yes gene_type:complete
MKCSYLCAIALALGFLVPSLVVAQTETTVAPEVVATSRPQLTDTTSKQLIRNYLAVSGGKQAYINLQNVIATGSIVEAGKLKSFRLIETQDGRRQLTYTWKHLGRKYKTLYSFDGVHTWQQELLPQEQYPEPFSGRDAIHFARQHWLIQPFVVPLIADYAFKYQGMSKVAGRPAYIVTGYGNNNIRSWFYFDKEKHLLTRWGGIGTIAGIEEYMDYRATRFATVNGVLLPKQIELLAENSPFGTITFETFSANQPIDSKIFYMPASTVPTLRQIVR